MQNSSAVFIAGSFQPKQYLAGLAEVVEGALLIIALATGVLISL